MTKVFRRVAVTLPAWDQAISTPGLKVYHRTGNRKAAHAYLLNNNAGIVLGKLFRHGIADRDREGDVILNARKTEEILATGGRCLVEQYWGRYVAVLRDADRQRLLVLRDPTGAMPCLLTYFHDVVVICSHIDDCAKARLVNEAINWKHVAAYLMHHRLITKETGLEGVRQVQAGECITIESSREDSSFYWRPERVHDARVFENRNEAAYELRKTIQYCVAEWASCYSRILHGLSGGLDSAVVLACLPQTAMTVICQNYFTKHAQGDERAYARIAARSAGVELIESLIRISDRPLKDMIDPTRVATPAQTYLVPDSELERAQLATQYGIDAVFSGQGGDHLFQQVRTPLIAADFVWRHGLRAGLANVIIDTAHLTRKSAWSILVATLYYGLISRRGDPYAQTTTRLLVTDSACEAFDHRSVRHPWVADAMHLPGNKRRQIVSIVDTQNFFYEPVRYADIVHPLISQPIIELCLQIPSYVLTYSGVDRALVRDAFSGLVAAEILHRADKGGTTGVFNQLLVENLSFIREFLLDGLLVKQGLLDKRKIGASVTEAELIRDVYLLFPLVHAILAESWARTWSSGALAAWTPSDS